MLFPAEIIDILKVLIILVCCYAMSYVDTSMLYHMIKSQSVIKLYLMYNMIEVADRLFRFVLKSSISCPFYPTFQVRFIQLFRFVLSDFSGSFYPTFQILSSFSSSFLSSFKVRVNKLFRFDFIKLFRFYQVFHSTFKVSFLFNCNLKNYQFFLFFFSAFGQDTIDALFWTATEPKGKKREHIGVVAHLLLAVGYVFLHALLVLLQVYIFK